VVGVVAGLMRQRRTKSCSFGQIVRDQGDKFLLQGEHCMLQTFCCEHSICSFARKLFPPTFVFVREGRIMNLLWHGREGVLVLGAVVVQLYS
jgi:hypothetical protein